jgi:predicted nucleic acid-binding protein
MSALFADTFYFLALLNSWDSSHAKATRYDDAQPSLVTTAWILTEVADALAAPENRPVFLGLMELLQKSPEVHIVSASDELFERGIELYRQRPDKDWSLTDCLSFVVMADEKITEVLTGDHHFEQAGFQALLK